MSGLRLSAGRAELTVDPADGGRWTSLQVDGLELLGGAELDGVPVASLSGCFPMAPYAGRVRRGRFTFRGRSHALPTTAPPHAIHGTVFTVPWTVTGSDGASATLTCELGPPWPYAGTVRQELALSPDGLFATLTLAAGQTMPVVLGWHPWFRRRLARGAEAVLSVEPELQYLRGEDGLPTGELAPPGPGPYDDCFLGLGGPPVLSWAGALELTLTSTARHWVLYDRLEPALCVEPQTGPPDAFTLGLADLVPAGQERAVDISLAWRVSSSS